MALCEPSEHVFTAASVHGCCNRVPARAACQDTSATAAPTSRRGIAPGAPLFPCLAFRIYHHFPHPLTLFPALRITDGAAARDGKVSADPDPLAEEVTEVSPDALVMCGFGEVGRALAKVLDDAGLGAPIDAALLQRLRERQLAAAGGPEHSVKHGARMDASAASDMSTDGGYDLVLPSIVAFTTREVRGASSPVPAWPCAGGR